MRIYDDLNQAVDEIIRDLTKAPIVHSSRVQNVVHDKTAHEAMGYHYTIQSGGIPDAPWDLIAVGKRYFEYWRKYESEIFHWMIAQRDERIWGSKDETDLLHPELKKFESTGRLSYTYRQRMIGIITGLCNTLSQDQGSRRAFWPIFNEDDAWNAPEMVRIPCTIGMSYIIRDVPELGPQLHTTLIQRSVDLEKFFLSDVWFAYQLQLVISEKLEIQCGSFSHFILSFHMFERDEEIF